MHSSFREECLAAMLPRHIDRTKHLREMPRNRRAVALALMDPNDQSTCLTSMTSDERAAELMVMTPEARLECLAAMDPEAGASALTCMPPWRQELETKQDQEGVYTQMRSVMANIRGLKAKQAAVELKTAESSRLSRECGRTSMKAEEGASDVPSSEWQARLQAGRTSPKAHHHEVVLIRSSWDADALSAPQNQIRETPPCPLSAATVVYGASEQQPGLAGDFYLEAAYDDIPQPTKTSPAPADTTARFDELYRKANNLAYDRLGMMAKRAEASSKLALENEEAPVSEFSKINARIAQIQSLKQAAVAQEDFGTAERLQAGVLLLTDKREQMEVEQSDRLRALERDARDQEERELRYKKEWSQIVEVELCAVLNSTSTLINLPLIARPKNVRLP